MRALAWKWFLRLAQRGKDANRFVFMFSRFLARAAIAGRRLAGMEKSNGVLCRLAQLRHSFTVSPLPEDNGFTDNALIEALHDNTQTPVPEQVSFRIDFPKWRRSRPHRDRKIIDQLMAGERTQNVARKFGISEGRVAQLRREFHQDWERYCAGPEITDVNG